MSIDDLDGSRGEFVARAPTSVFRRGCSWILTSSIHAASDLAASAFIAPLNFPWLLPASVRKIFLPRPLIFLSLWLLWGPARNHFPLAHSASGTQFEHHGVGNNPFHPCCLKPI